MGKRTRYIEESFWFLFYPCTCQRGYESLGEREDSWKNYKGKRLVVIVLLIALILVAVAIPTVACYRDFNRIDKDSANQVALTVVYELVLKIGNTVTNFSIRVFIAGLYWRYVSKWDEKRSEIFQTELSGPRLKRLTLMAGLASLPGSITVLTLW